MEKLYPPIYINYIIQKDSETLVKVTFYRCSLGELKLAAKEGRNAKGSIKKQKVFELPKMTAEQARETIYSKFIKGKIAKRVIVPKAEKKYGTI